MGSPYILGALYPPDEIYAKFTQPGGPGTPVFPQQQIGEQIGTFMADCGHYFLDWMVQMGSYKDNEGVTHRVALITCPLCGYLNQIVDPYELINTDAFYFI